MTRTQAFRFALNYSVYRIRKGLTLVRTDKDGVAAVEFALLLPLTDRMKSTYTAP